MQDVSNVGLIIGPHGVQGHLKIGFSVEIQNLIKGTWLFLNIQKKPVPFFIEEAWGETKNWVVKLKGINKPEEIKTLHRVEVLVNNDLIKQDQEDLEQGFVGYEIIDAATNTLLGEITNVFDNSAHLVAQLNYNDQELMLPLHDDLIVNIDLEAKRITLQLPEGLLDL